MCGSLLLSVGFAALHAGVAWRAARSPHPYRRAFALFCSFYACMEALQAAQWVGFGWWGGTCTPGNTTLTLFANLLIHAQPLMFAYIGYSTVDRDRFRYGVILSALALGAAVVNTVPGGNSEDADVGGGSGLLRGQGAPHDLPMNFGNLTCTTVGSHGHLLWRFAVRHLYLQPSYWYYMASIVTCFVLYHPPPGSPLRTMGHTLGLTLGVGWIASFAAALLLVRTSPELPAYWCWLSVFADLPIIFVCWAWARKGGLQRSRFGGRTTSV